MVKLFVSRMYCMTFTSLRCFSAKPKVILDETTSSLLFTKDIKHRNHPGIIKPKTPIFPKWALTKISNILKDKQVSIKGIKESAKKLLQHLSKRHPPIQEAKLYEKLLKVEQRLNANKHGEKIHIENIDFNQNRQVRNILKQNIYNWQPINFDNLTCLTYMVGRVVQNYTVSSRILNEIRARDQGFKPETLFDFGSGLGTVMWAASEIWPNSLKEYLCVEISKPMIELSETLAKAANPKIENIFYRQYFPVSNSTYDIVVSAYSLFELPGMQARLETILNLWQKTKHYLVIIEQGSNAGYELVNEARDFILKYTNSRFKHNMRSGYVFSPCPHDLKCPRFADSTPCNFEVLYHPLPLLDKHKHESELYSYVVLKKDQRPENDEQWPRIVRATLHRSKHIICRMCVASGELKEEIFTKYKHGKDMYCCAKNSQWGDRLPIHYKEQEDILKGDDTTNEGTIVE